MPVHVQTKTEIRATLAALGIRPRRRLGQNFLIDGNLMRRLADAAEIGPNDVVLEVGPGTGGLTDLLVGRAHQVIAVEIDRALAAHLRDRFAEQANFTLIERDVLANKNRLAPDVVEAVNRAAVCRRVLLVANLPYGVASPLLLNLLHELPVVRRYCFAVQRDVADKMVAAPGCKAYGPLSIVLQAATEVRRIAQVPATAFWPQPKVESTMLRLDRVAQHLSGPTEVAAFATLVRNGFAHRRKTLRYNLVRCLDEGALADAAESTNLSRRPEQLTVDEWLELARRAGKRVSG